MPDKQKKKKIAAVREDAPEYGSVRPRPTYDLEMRTEQFARDVRAFFKLLPRSTANDEDGRQLIRASGSVGANYIEANEAVSRKDFLLRIKIARKEAKETRYWLRLVDAGGSSRVEETCKTLIQESTELMNILSAIYRKCD